MCVSVSQEGYLFKLKKMEYLTKAFYAIMIKIEKSSIGDSNKILLRRRVQEKVEKIEIIKQADEDLTNEIFTGKK